MIVGADRVAANGDIANKIGTYIRGRAGASATASRSTWPRRLSTIDLAIADGDDIPIEERDPREVTGFGDTQIAPEGVTVAQPGLRRHPRRTDHRASSPSTA